VRLKVRGITASECRKKADSFLKEHQRFSSIPVDIEKIAELDLGLDIVPVPGLRIDDQTVSWLASNLESIWVDAEVYERWEVRYRFSLAHEIAHIILHEDIYRSIELNSTKEWKDFIFQANAYDYWCMERQANQMAGFLLVPPGELVPRFRAVAARAKKSGLDLATCPDVAVDYVAAELSADFNVSHQAMVIRIREDRLL